MFGEWVPKTFRSAVCPRVAHHCMGRVELARRRHVGTANPRWLPPILQLMSTSVRSTSWFRTRLCGQASKAEYAVYWP